MTHHYEEFYDGIEAADRTTAPEKPVLWRNAFGEPVDLDDIDREYALNIYTMVIQRRTLAGYGRDELREDRLVEKLREVILNGREENLSDRIRAKVYNARTRAAGLPYRA